MGEKMAKAIPISDADWNFATRIRSNQDFFNFLSRSYVFKNAVPAQKVHTVEFFAKP